MADIAIGSGMGGKVLYQRADGSTYFAYPNASTNLGGGNISIGGTSTSYNQPASIAAPSVLGAYTTGGGGSGGGSVPVSSTPSVPTYSGPSQLDLIRMKLEEARKTAGEEEAKALQGRNQLFEFLTQQYGDLQNRAGQTKQAAFDRLSQEGTNLRNIYERAMGDQRRRAANAELKNRNTARALNRLDSSFYDEAQAGTTADLRRALGTLGTEEAGKSAALATRNTETGNYFDNLLTDLSREESQAKLQGQNQYESAVQNAERLRRAGLQDFGGDINQVGQFTQGLLGQIQQSVAAQQQAQQQAALQAALQSGNINNFQAINSQLAGALGNNTGLNSVMQRLIPVLGGNFSQGPAVNAMGSGSTLDDLIKQFQLGIG